jgi:hypothetical protein
MTRKQVEGAVMYFLKPGAQLTPTQSAEMIMNYVGFEKLIANGRIESGEATALAREFLAYGRKQFANNPMLQKLYALAASTH